MDPVFDIRSDKEFDSYALKIFRQQYQHVRVYHDFVDYLRIQPDKILSPEEIPFLPVELFKNHRIIDSRKQEKILFYSSGTAGYGQSKHYVADPELYEHSFFSTFEFFYGHPSQYCILALLPYYLEREGSSLIYMMDKLIRRSSHSNSGFYLRDYGKLMRMMKKLQKEGKKTLVLGVSFALIELAGLFQEDLSNIIFMETGGMKGRAKEITRTELHEILKKSFNLTRVHSEYGMTELMSQAYSSGEGLFYSPPWMKVLVRDSYDPLKILPEEKTGSLNVIDLANLYSCSFLATSDLGITHTDKSFEVLGRIDDSDLRGCNLLLG